MANRGPNKRRRLQAALSRFAAMLIEEAQDLTGLSYERLDEALGFPPGRCTDYSKYPLRRKTRAPQADEIQNLENLTAQLLKRPAHVVVMENRRSQNRSVVSPVDVIGAPDLGINLRDFDQNELQLGYEDDWPTYRRLKYSAIRYMEGVDLLQVYAWQWGVLWDKGALPEPWTRETQNVPHGMPIEEFIPVLVEKAKDLQRAYWEEERLAAGILPETPAHLE